MTSAGAALRRLPTSPCFRPAAAGLSTVVRVPRRDSVPRSFFCCYYRYIIYYLLHIYLLSKRNESEIECCLATVVRTSRIHTTHSRESKAQVRELF